MFERLTLEQKLVAINVLIFVLVGASAMLLLGGEKELPDTPQVGLISESLESLAEEVQESGTTRGATEVNNFGKVPAFQPLIPLPTPTPRPTPTPVPDPSLKEAIANWRVMGVANGIVFLEDTRSKDEWFMDVDDRSTLTKRIRFQNVDMEVKLKSLDEINLTATFRWEGINDPPQEETRGMFED